MNCRILLTLTALSFPFLSTQAQQIVYLTDHPGSIVKGSTQAVKGFNTACIIGVVNKIPMINHPVGYDVKESQSAYNWPGSKATTGSVILGFPPWYKVNNGPEQKQVEFPLLQFIINKMDDLTNESYFLQDETSQAHLPQMFTDTIAFRYEIRNGENIGVSTNEQGFRYILINPRNKPCFVPVTKEQLITLWISKLNMEIGKYKGLIASNATYLNSQKAGGGSAQLINQLENNNKSYNVWLTYLAEKKKQYQDKLASLSAAEKKAPAEYGMPSKIAALTNRDGSLVTKVQGDMMFELADLMTGGTTKKGQVFIYNPEFFNPKLPRTAFQLILIKDATRIGYGKEDRIQKLLNKEFYPQLDYKALAALMQQ